MVTPSLVITGEPVIFSRMTLRPLGPRVDLTASASWSTPASRRARASAPKRSSLAMKRVPAYVIVRVIRMTLLGDEDGTAADPAGVEVGEGVGRGVQRVGLGVQRDLAVLGQHHQLGQFVVGTDDVADDVAFGGDDVQARALQRSAGADALVRPGPPDHAPAPY